MGNVRCGSDRALSHDTRGQIQCILNGARLHFGTGRSLDRRPKFGSVGRHMPCKKEQKLGQWKRDRQRGRENDASGLRPRPARYPI